MKNQTSSASHEKIVATPRQGTRGSKTNDECASLRKNNLPKSEKVMDAKEIKDATLECVKTQCGTPDDTRRTVGNSGSR
jgi:hypothetical protein